MSHLIHVTFNHNEFISGYCIPAAIYCFGTVSNCNGKLLLALLIKVTKIQHTGDKYLFHQSQPNRLNIKTLKGKERN